MDDRWGTWLAGTPAQLLRDKIVPSGHRRIFIGPSGESFSQCGHDVEDIPVPIAACLTYDPSTEGGAQYSVAHIAFTTAQQIGRRPIWMCLPDEAPDSATLRIIGSILLALEIPVHFCVHGPGRELHRMDIFKLKDFDNETTKALRKAFDDKTNQAPRKAV
ncbi:uncharacterized protein MYCGRDRAFT_98086 [Zymoseptoria tritici IPO323]|uniref:Uncharacterized protein n=1 Tax=Zymoseptoria tritici (strain CBS 115943 / IPO323) TaxID=336722 RepID=F9XS96_ZYMTI|nr:uncharacterized protein MYCGRDRAFT_98086 [Zymoseptoria tritici IPO323]EGP81877.1 hypothetical protein MYCGRDRAFT_98086 [Zymoseptoria tritici IPO323]